MEGLLGASEKKKKVVVVGGGVAGSLVAKTLQDHAQVVLVDSKEYFEIPWASLRSLVEPSFAERSVINHSDYLPNADIVIATATNITESEILTEQGQSIEYDFLVIASGYMDTGALARSENYQAGPETRTKKLSQYQSEHQKIKASNTILIVGGGPTGVELAGEIAVDFPDKKVILVHRGSRLLEFIGHKASRKTLDWLTSKKVEVILGQSVNLSSVSDGAYPTSGGETITADCHFNCTGKPMGSSWLKETVLKNSLDSHGRLMVDENLRVKGRMNVFGIGDITDIPEIKQGFLAKKHAQVAATRARATHEKFSAKENKNKYIIHHIEAQKDPREQIESREDPLQVKGRFGVFAKRRICKGSFVCEYAGDLIDRREAERRDIIYELKEKGSYMFYFNWNDRCYCLDATEPTSRLGRLVNHSRKKPNCKMEIFIHDNKPYLILTAIRDIEPNDELLYDYGERNKEAIKANPWLEDS